MFGKLLKPAEVCERLNVDLKTLWKWRRQSDGPPCIDLGGVHRYPAEGVELWLEHLERRGNPELLAEVERMAGVI